MRFSFFILLSFFCSFQSFGQDSLSQTTPCKLCFKVLPFSLLDLYSGSSIRIGSELRIKKNFSINGEVGFFYPKKPLFWQSDEILNNKGFCLRAEFKFYRKYYYEGEYYSFDLFYKNQSFSTSDTINLGTKYLKEYSISKNVFAINFNYGKMNVYYDKFIVEFCVGGGVRLKMFDSELSPEENDHIISESDYSTNVFNHKEGQLFAPNIVIGVKFGYKFK